MFKQFGPTEIMILLGLVLMASPLVIIVLYLSRISSRLHDLLELRHDPKKKADRQDGDKERD